MTQRWGVLALCAFVVSCGGASLNAPPKTDRLTPSVLYPLGAGHVWSYDVDSGDETPTLAITKVDAVQGAHVVVRTNQGEPVRYELASGGIAAPGGRWLLRAPIRTGASWPSPGGRVATVVSVDESITTMAGPFDRCVRVLEQSGEIGVQVVTVFCPEVGPVFVESSMKTERATVVVTARLRGYSFNPVD